MRNNNSIWVVQTKYSDNESDWDNVFLFRTRKNARLVAKSLKNARGIKSHIWRYV